MRIVELLRKWIGSLLNLELEKRCNYLLYKYDKHRYNFNICKMKRHCKYKDCIHYKPHLDEITTDPCMARFCLKMKKFVFCINKFEYDKIKNNL